MKVRVGEWTIDLFMKENHGVLHYNYGFTHDLVNEDITFCTTCALAQSIGKMFKEHAKSINPGWMLECLIRGITL